MAPQESIHLSLFDMLGESGSAIAGKQLDGGAVVATSLAITGAATRKNFQPHHAQSVPKPDNLVRDADGVPATTMMLRNIPNKYTQGKLLQELDECGFSGTYNFFYLPMDVHNRSNVGYAFINFHLPADAEHFRQVFSLHRFQRFHSRKVGTVCVAHVQGLDQNLRHFENRAVTQAKNDQYRPIVFDGSVRVDFEEALVLAKAGLPDNEEIPGQSLDSPVLLQLAEPTTPSARTPPTLPTPSKESRRGSLEAAILELLKANTPTNLDAGYTGGDRAAVESRLVDFSVQPRGVLQAAGADDEQLLSLRSRLGDRLRDARTGLGSEAVPLPLGMSSGPPPGLGAPSMPSFEKPPHGVETCFEPAYIAVPSPTRQQKAVPSKLAMPEFINSATDCDDFMNCATPRTNGLFLGQTLDSMVLSDGTKDSFSQWQDL